MAGEQKAKHGGNKKYGRNVEKCKIYRMSKRKEHNKSRRILQSNGKDACAAYCTAHEIKLPKRYHTKEK